MKITANTTQEDFENYLSTMKDKLLEIFPMLESNNGTELDSELIDECLNSLVDVYTIHETMTIQDFIDDNTEDVIEAIILKDNIDLVDKAYNTMKNGYTSSDDDMVTGEDFDVFYAEILNILK